ncbi:C2 domain-containing protein [Rhodotorula toruloides]
MVQLPPPPSPTSGERLLGTLVVIVLRAKNLPNRVRIGKQNPYATVTYGLHKKRTDTIERGGQQPEWDAEFRFEILKDDSNSLVVAPLATGYPPGRRVLRIACWADDARDPKLIGEGELDIEETIKVGKFDDWVKLERKGRYAGEVYLELTWYSNVRPFPSLRDLADRESKCRVIDYGADSRCFAGTSPGAHVAQDIRRRVSDSSRRCIRRCRLTRRGSLG